MLRTLGIALLVASSVGLAHECEFQVAGAASHPDQYRAEAQAMAYAKANFRSECERARCASCPDVTPTLHESFPDPISEAWRATAGASGRASSCEEACR